MTANCCVLLPPLDDWVPFIDIKRKHLKRSIKRPPYPHITMAQPVQNTYWKTGDRLYDDLQAIPKFRLTYSTIKILNHGAKASLYVEPVDTPRGSLIKVLEVLKKHNVVNRNKQKQFLPHVGLGVFRSYRDADQARKRYQDNWKNITHDVCEIYLLNRKYSDPNDTPWTIANKLPLSGHTTDVIPVGTTTRHPCLNFPPGRYTRPRKQLGGAPATMVQGPRPAPVARPVQATPAGSVKLKPPAPSGSEKIWKMIVDPETGISYRNSPNMDDKNEEVAPRGEIVEGPVREVNGTHWLKNRKNGLFLPGYIMVDGKMLNLLKVVSG